MPSTGGFFCVLAPISTFTDLRLGPRPPSLSTVSQIQTCSPCLSLYLNRPSDSDRKIAILLPCHPRSFSQAATEEESSLSVSLRLVCLYLAAILPQLLTALLTSSNIQLSSNFSVCSTDADLSFLSSDGVLYRLHSKYLDVNADGFPPGNLPQPLITGQTPEPAPLSESSSTLHLLFQHVYPRPHPHLDELGFEVLAEVAEAAEKYQVYSAMEACRLLMKYVWLCFCEFTMMLII